MRNLARKIFLCNIRSLIFMQLTYFFIYFLRTTKNVYLTPHLIKSV